jgi:hypothetical protein
MYFYFFFFIWLLTLSTCQCPALDSLLGSFYSGGGVVSRLQGFPTFRVLASTRVPKYICPNKAEVSKRQYLSKAKSCNDQCPLFCAIQRYSTVYLAVKKSRTLELLALYAKIKQNYRNGNIHRKLRVPTSEREGKLSNPRARAARARCMEKIYGNLRKPARPRRARAMYLFPCGQVYSKYIG